MTQFKGTSGKFHHELIEACDGNIFISVLDENDTSIAFCGKDSVAEANARLFSAAPDLLEALIEARVWVQGWNASHETEDSEKALIACNQAIAKALGEQS